MREKRSLIVACCVTFAVSVAATLAFMVFFNVGIGDKIFVSLSDYQNAKKMADKYSGVESIYQFLEKNYYSKLDDNELMTGIYRGLMEGTGDPYTKYMTKEEYQNFADSFSGGFSGIGITMSVSEEGNIEVISVVEDSPAQKAGIKDGDVIVCVDDVRYSGETLSEAADKMRGEEGTKVKVTVSRKGTVKEFEIVRASISNITVHSDIMENNVGYIRITSFAEETANQFKTELEKLEEKKVNGLVIDLRSNGGGLVDESVEIADMLMDKGTIVYLEDGNGKRKYYKSEDGRTDLNYAVLVNGGSASASEILVAGIQGNKEGIIVGTQTYGKGITQNTWELANGAGLEITTCQYFAPNGSVIHKKGIKPDIVVELEESDIEDDVIVNDRQLQEAIKALRK